MVPLQRSDDVDTCVAKPGKHLEIRVNRQRMPCCVSRKGLLLHMHVTRVKVSLYASMFNLT